MLSEIGDAAFNGNDPLKPVFRTKLEATHENLLTVRESLLTLLSVDVVLREPSEEELQELRDWLASIPSESY